MFVDGFDTVQILCNYSSVTVYKGLRDGFRKQKLPFLDCVAFLVALRV